MKTWQILIESVSLQDVGRRFTVGQKKREIISVLVFAGVDKHCLW